MEKINDIIKQIVSNKEDILRRINNTTYGSILKLRNEAAENGIEFTPDEIVEHIKFLKEIVSDEWRSRILCCYKHS